MVASGLVERVTSPSRRQRPVAITGLGSDLLADVEGIYSDLEDEWATVLGPGRLDALRSDLTAALVATNDGKLPPVRPGI